MRVPHRLYLMLAAVLTALATAAVPARPAIAAASPAPSPGSQAVCGPSLPGFARCLSVVRTGIKGRTGLFPAGQAPAGYGPASLQSAYQLPSATAGHGQTVAIVDAYDDPNAAVDLAVYRSQYGLPPCTTANGCFRKVAQDGSSSYPPPNPDWALEISLDLDMVSAICPNCRILLVEANDDSFTSLGAAVNEAVALGARYVSNSYGAPESQLTTANEASLDTSYFNHPGVAITAASGDNGYLNGQDVVYPAASPDVTAVGGTSLVKDASIPLGWRETGWVNSRGSAGAGSGCSAAEAKPAWQNDTGCAHRTVADVAAVADPYTGVAAYDTYPAPANPGYAYGWNVMGGTSAASPVIASVYALAGPPSAAVPPSSYPYADPSGLNDITSDGTSGGSAGCVPAYLCNAGPGYDGPTGLGTPHGVTAFGYGVRGPHGTVTGTITDAVTGNPVAGARVSAGGYAAITDAAGHYDLTAVPGVLSVTASAFGYAAKTVPGVAVTAGHTVTENFALSGVPSETVSGTVADGSGQHWPLYASVSVSGTPVTVYTDPATGRYRMRLPADATYRVQVNPVYPGYRLVRQDVTVAAADITRNFTAQVDPIACDAPGYHPALAFSENFNNDKDKIPPGWSVINLPDDASGNTWRFDQPGGYPNDTGGTGNYATAYTASVGHQIDTELITPLINLSADPQPSLNFGSAAYNSPQAMSVGLSTDGGRTWSTVWTQTGVTSSSVTVPLPKAGGQSSVRLRFRLTTQSGQGDIVQFWQVDDIGVTECAPASGGLLAGQVRDANTGQGIDGATITSAGQSVASAAVPADPGPLGHGFYWLFSKLTGGQAVTAAAPGYLSQTARVTVGPGRVTLADLRLKAGRLAVAPGSVTATAAMGGRTAVTVTVRNIGTAAASLKVTSQPGGFTLPGQPATPAVASAGAPLRRIFGHFRPGLVPQRPAAPGQGLTGVPPGPGAGITSWTAIEHPPVTLGASTAAADPVTGRLYLVGGSGNSAWVFDPSAGRWAALPPMSNVRDYAQAAFLGGKLYVTGGGSAQLEIYDPASRTWAQGSPSPRNYTAAATAVLDGKMYVVGGCNAAGCGESDVQVYNPVTGQWSAAAPYPVPVSDLGCGAIAGKIYCAGGVNNTATFRAGYVYDPHTNAWRSIAALPVDLWGSAYAAANGRLLITDGVTGGSTVITNQGYAYNPATNTWSALPDAPITSFEPASACGFYLIGGWAPARVGNAAAPGAAQLPGYGDCGGQDWVSANPDTATLGPGQSVKITVTLAATAPSVTQPGDYTAALRVGTTTPYPAPVVPVRLTVTPPKTWGEVTGTVSGTSCAGSTAPLPGAPVQVDGRHGTWPLETDSHGGYALWLDAGNDPLTVIASMNGWQSQAAKVSIVPGKATVRNFTLKAAACH